MDGFPITVIDFTCRLWNIIVADREGGHKGRERERILLTTEKERERCTHTDTHNMDAYMYVSIGYVE